ncbi:MAG: Ppx/GppA phosphatase family protein [Gammaproteobacteria bacterium]|nr:Ppx/GppA phosphatase family protein [Gammaproteobacteria bacterium]
MQSALLTEKRVVADQLDQPYAALDLGSNSFHLIVANDRPGRLQVIDRHREVVRLAAGLELTHRISRRSMAVAMRALARIGERIRDLPKHNVRVVGTNALRTALNRDEFIEAAERLLGQRVEIISGREEARLIYLGALQSLEDDADRRLVVDIGGGSTEVIFGKKFHPRMMESLRMGCISMTERWFGDGKVTEKRMQRATNNALQELKAIEQTFRSLECEYAVGTSGTILATHNAIAHDSSLTITKKSLAMLQGQVIKLGHVDRMVGLVNSDRAPLFPGGLAILIALFNALDLDSMQVSNGALREGLLSDLLGRIHDRDIRESSVKDLMVRFNVDTVHAQRVCDTVMFLLDQIQHDWGLENSDNEKLLRWGAQLHEIGMDISHSSYHKHGGYLLQHFDMAGFSLRDQHVLASLVRGHRRAYPLDFDQDNPAIAKLTILLRLAVLLKRNRTGESLPKCRLSVVDSGLHLVLDRKWLKKHRLTLLDLEQECSYLQSAPYQLSIKTQMN